jgi:hypothetical protein
MDSHVIHEDSFMTTNSTVGIGVSVKMTIVSTWRTHIDFSLNGASYNFSIDKWRCKRLTGFLQRFHEHKARDCADYGSIHTNEEGTHATVSSTLTSWHQMCSGVSHNSKMCNEMHQIWTILLLRQGVLYMVGLRAVKAECKAQIDVCLLNDNAKAVAAALQRLSVLVSFGIEYDLHVLEKHAPSYTLGRSLCPFQVLQIVKARHRYIDRWSVVEPAYSALFNALVADVMPSTGTLADLHNEQVSEVQSMNVPKKTIKMAIAKVDRQEEKVVAERLAAMKQKKHTERYSRSNKPATPGLT